VADERDALDDAIDCFERETNSDAGDCARSIRARERKLAELARALIADLRKYEGADWEATKVWISRYEEALK